MKSPLAPQPVPLKLDSMPAPKGPFSANIHAIIHKYSVSIPHTMCCWKMVGSPPKMHGLGPNIHLKSPLAPQSVPLKLDSMPHSKGPFSANIHPIIPKLSVPIHGHVLSKNGGEPPPKIHGLGPKIHLKSPLAPQPVPLKLDSTPPSKYPFSANIHPIIPKLSVPIPQGMCFRKMVGDPFDNARVGAQITSEITLSTPAVTTDTWFNATFYGPIPREYTPDHSQTLCAYTAGHVLPKYDGGPPPKMHRLGPKIHLK